MTGGLLGALNGIEWFQDQSEQVQDAHYLRIVAEHLAKEKNAALDIKPLTLRISKQDFKAFSDKLEASIPNENLVLPDGREAYVSQQHCHQTRSKNISAVSWKLTTIDGQSIYINKISRVKNPIENGPSEVSNTTTEKQSNVDAQNIEVVKTGIQILVQDIAKARLFYEKTLGLKVQKESKFFVNLGGTIALVSADHEKRLGEPPKHKLLNRNVIIYIEIRSLSVVYENVKQFGAEIIEQISYSSGRKFFRCLDPDMNIVEIAEMTGIV